MHEPSIVFEKIKKKKTKTEESRMVECTSLRINVKGQLRIIISTKLVGLETKMLYTKFKGSMFLGPDEEKFQRVLPSWTTD